MVFAFFILVWAKGLCDGPSLSSKKPYRMPTSKIPNPEMEGLGLVCLSWRTRTKSVNCFGRRAVEEGRRGESYYRAQISVVGIPASHYAGCGFRPRRETGTSLLLASGFKHGSSTAVPWTSFFFYSILEWGNGTSAPIWPVGPAPDDGGWVWSSRRIDWQGKQKCSEKTCPSAALPTTNLSWLDLCSIHAVTAVGIRCTDHTTPSTLKSWHWLHRQVAAAR
jgi:hypothetical protein